MYATIDQDAAAVANIATPMDEKLAALNTELNNTYVAFGRAGESFLANQQVQDENAELMSAAAVASRTITKASVLYNSAHWDLVDAMQAGRKLEELSAEELPENMHAMDEDERRDYINEQTEQRAASQHQIAELDKKRRAYIDQKRKETQTDSAKGLDEAIREGLRALAEKKGFSFGEG